MKISKTQILHDSQTTNTLKNLSSTYQQRLAEQRAKNGSNLRNSQTTRNVSVSSHNQTRPNPMDKQYSYISGKPKAQF